jgi:hypothetical protein
MTWLNLVELSKLGQFTQILTQVTNNDKASYNCVSAFRKDAEVFRYLLLLTCVIKRNLSYYRDIDVSEVSSTQLSEFDETDV